MWCDTFQSSIQNSCLMHISSFNGTFWRFSGITNLFLIQNISLNDNICTEHEFGIDDWHISHHIWCQCIHVVLVHSFFIKSINQNKLLLFFFQFQNFIISHILQLEVATTFEPGYCGTFNLQHLIYCSSRDISSIKSA